MAQETTSYVAPEESEDGLDVVLRGYDRRQVDTLLEQYEARLTHTEHMLDAAEEQVRELTSENAELTAQLRKARETLARDGKPSYAELGERVMQMLRLAEDEAGAIRASAAADAERACEQAMKHFEGERAGLLAELGREREELEACRVAAQQEWQTLRQEGVEHAEWLVGQARGEAEKMVADAGREVAELTRQRDQVRGELRRLREILTTATDPMQVGEG